MDKFIYSIIIGLLFIANLASVITVTPVYSESLKTLQATGDIKLLSAFNITDPLLASENISIYFTNCCLFALIDLQALLDQGVELSPAKVLVTDDVNKVGIAILEYIDLNYTTSTWLTSQVGEYNVKYMILRNNNDPNLVLLIVNITTIKPILEEYDLLRKPLWLRIRDYDVPYPDSAISDNRFAVIEPFDIDWDQYVTIDYYINDKEVGKAKYGTFVNITIRLPSELEDWLDIPDEPPLTFNEFYNITVWMVNIDNEADKDLIFNETSGTSNKYFGTTSGSITSDGYYIVINGTVQDFRPEAFHDDGSHTPKILYGLDITLFYNKTLNLTLLGFDLSGTDASDCPNVEDSLAVSKWNVIDTTDEKYVEIWSSVEEIDRNEASAGPDDALNPGDSIVFSIHHLPEPYDGDDLEEILFTTDYKTIHVTSFSIASSLTDGVVEYNVTLPEEEWGGLTAFVAFNFSDTQWILIKEHPDCYLLNTTVYPYAELGVLPNDDDATDHITRDFYDPTVSDHTVAPGDYILVKGHGFITKDGVDVYINDTIKLEKLLEVNRSDDPDLDPGTVYLVVKVWEDGGNIICLLIDENGTMHNRENNRVTVIGTLYPSTNRYMFDYNLTIGFHSVLWKVMINPEPYYDNVTKKVYIIERDPAFEVYYPLVDDPEAPGGDRFDNGTWDEFKLEIIGFNSTYVLVYLNRTRPYPDDYLWNNLSLTCGYALKDYTGETIPFLPMGYYNITVINGTKTIVPDVLGKLKTYAFKIHPNLDIDVLPTDDTEGRRCDNVSISIVGGLPDSDLTLEGEATITIQTDMFGGPELWRTESLAVSISTDEWGTGNVVINGTVFYSTSELESDIHRYLDSKLFVMTTEGDIEFNINYSAVFYSFTNDSTTVSYADSEYDWGTNTEREFILELEGSVHYFAVTDEIDWEASVHIPRTQLVITVPEVVLPGDEITIQIVVHKTETTDNLVIPDQVWDILYPYWIDVRIVDLTASSTGTGWTTLYGGWLEFDSVTTEIVLDGGRVAKLERLLEDIDGDGVNEMVFLVKVPAPLVSSDVTLRVDVKVRLAFENTANETTLELRDEACYFFANYTGARIWATKYTNILYGGDHQLVTVLGLLEAKLDYINETTVYIKAKVDDTWTYLRFNLTYFLEAMNNSIITKIDGSTATILTKIGEINVSLTDLMLTLANEVEVKIDDSTATIIAKLEDVNETLYLKIEESTDFLASLIGDLFTRLDELEANVIYTIYAVNSSIIRHIDVVADDLRYDILLRIDEAETTLSDLITVKADEIEYFINETTTTIIAKIGESTLTITDAIDSAKTDLEVYIDGQTATIRSDIATVKTDTESIIDLVNALQTSVSDLSVKLVQVNDTLYALVLSVGDDVKATIVGKADDILGFLNEFKTATDTSFSDVLSAIDELSTNVENAKTEILANLSGVYSDLSSKLDDVSSAISSARTSIEDKITSAKDELSTKADTLAGDLKKTVEEKTDAVNSNVTTFSLTLLILIVVLIGLVGYSVIAARRVR